MPFNTALSGIRAASSDLRITGNNIANASTTGFKSSRAEFGDVYATTILGGGQNLIGSGVRVSDVAQQFDQGNISFTESTLDLAISGAGFFVVSQDGDRLYSRAGNFGLDDEGYVVNNVGARLQGFSADDAGNISGVIGDLQIQAGNQPPQLTTQVESQVNLDSREDVLQSIGTALSTDGTLVGDAQTGLQAPVTTTVVGNDVPFPSPAFDFTANTINFDVTLNNSSGNNGTVSVVLNFVNGSPASLGNLNDANAMVAAINAQLFNPTVAGQSAIDVVASVVENTTTGEFHIELQALEAGETSTVSVSSGANADVIGLDGNPSDSSGTPAANNGYESTSMDIIDPSGDTVSYTSQRYASAAETAAELNALAGVSATATTTAILRGQQSLPADPTDTGYVNQSGNLVITLNGVDLTSDSLLELEAEINALSSSTLPGVSASYDAGSGDLIVTSAIGDDLSFSISSPDEGDSIEVQGGNSISTAEVLEIDTDNTLLTPTSGSRNVLAAGGNAIVTGGTIDLVLDEGYNIDNITPFGFLFSANYAANAEPVVLNEFDPNDQTTYNHATSLTIYDSLGNAHVMTQYFVKQDYNPDDPLTSPNHWLMYVLIDGQDIGDPVPGETEPTRESYNIHFNQNGSLNPTLSDTLLISNWVPLDENGEPNGALGPLNVLAGGTTPIPDPPTSSNFEIMLNGSTQFGNDFAVNSVDQNGYTTGRLSGVSIDAMGVVFARFTNGEAQAIAQVALADFPNVQGLQQVGDTMWAENFESGVPNISSPDTAALGVIQSGALEESNVDLSQQLVALIIAQRNFQASAKTIETADQTTQTIINLR